MDKESVFELQKIDCNCNDCIHLERDFEKYKLYNYMYIENGRVTNPSHRPLYGNCLKLSKPISFLPNTCQIETQECFNHRREPIIVKQEEIKDTTNWKISLSSKSNKHNLSDKQIEDVLHCYNDEDYQKFKSDFNKKMRDEYDQYPVTKWQNAKSEEIENKFLNNIKYNIIEDIVEVSIEFEMKFTENFCSDDVINWTHGLNRLRKIHPMIQQKKIIKKEYIDDNEEHFLNELCDYENINVIKIES